MNKPHSKSYQDFCGNPEPLPISAQAWIKFHLIIKHDDGWVCPSTIDTDPRIKELFLKGWLEPHFPLCDLLEIEDVPCIGLSAVDDARRGDSSFVEGGEDE